MKLKKYRVKNVIIYKR
jgi:signal peptidase I